MMMMMMMMVVMMMVNSENEFFRIHREIRFLSDASRKT